MLYYIVKQYPHGEESLGHYRYRANAEKEIKKIEAAGGKARMIEAGRLLRPFEIREAIDRTA